MYETILVGELSERLCCILRTVIGHNDLRYAMACEERLQLFEYRFRVGSLEFGHFEESRVIVDHNQVLFDYRFRVGSLEFGHFEESRVIVDHNQVLRVMPGKQVCSNAFPWSLWKFEWHQRFTMLWTIPLTLSARSDHVCNLAR